MAPNGTAGGGNRIRTCACRPVSRAAYATSFAMPAFVDRSRAVSGFNAYELDHPLHWIEPWWRESDHEPLQRVMTLVATVEGYDSQMLMPRETERRRRPTRATACGGGVGRHSSGRLKRRAEHRQC